MIPSSSSLFLPFSLLLALLHRGLLLEDIEEGDCSGEGEDATPPAIVVCLVLVHFDAMRNT